MRLGLRLSFLSLLVCLWFLYGEGEQIFISPFPRLSCGFNRVSTVEHAKKNYWNNQNDFFFFFLSFFLPSLCCRVACQQCCNREELSLQPGYFWKSNRAVEKHLEKSKSVPPHPI